MKSLLGIFLLTVGALSAQQYGYPSNGNQYGQQMEQPQPQQGVPSDCSHLSQQEQQFASQLSDMHRTMFCRHFSVSQRIEAMTLATSPVQGLSGQPAQLSPDEAVEIVMKNARQNGNGQQQVQPQQPAQPQSPYGGSYSYPNRNSNGRYSPDR